MLGTSLISNIIIGVLLLIAVASIGGNVWQHFDNSNLSHQLSLSKENYNTARRNYLNCNKTVSDLNKNIQAQKQNLTQLQADLNKLKTEISVKEKENNSLLNKIKKEPAPKTCKELENYLYKNIGNLKW